MPTLEEVLVVDVSSLNLISNQLTHNIIQLVTKALEQEKATVRVTYEN